MDAAISCMLADEMAAYEEDELQNKLEDEDEMNQMVKAFKQKIVRT